MLKPKGYLRVIYQLARLLRSRRTAPNRTSSSCCAAWGSRELLAFLPRTRFRRRSPSSSIGSRRSPSTAHGRLAVHAYFVIGVRSTQLSKLQLPAGDPRTADPPSRIQPSGQSA